MKHFFKKVFIVPLIGAIVVCNISANKSNWSGMNLSQDEISNSVHFQLQRGSTCIGEFKKLQPVLDRFISQKIDVTYLNNYLGNPDNIIAVANEIQYHYYLTEKNDGCILNLVTKKGNLISYKVENCATSKITQYGK